MKPSNNENQNFWISYADLMAGLLFIFILLIGAIVIKYVLLQNNLHDKDAILNKEQQELKKTKDELITTQDTLKAIKILLSDTEEENKKATLLIAQKNEIIQEDKKNLNQQNEVIKAKDDEIKNIKQTLLKNEENLSREHNLLQNLKQKLDESVKLTQLTKAELSKITQKLVESTLAHQKLVEDLNITKARIKNLTGIRIKVIKTLKKKMGKYIQIDANSGAIRLSSSLLFDKNSDELKPNSKRELKNTLVKYINTLLKDKNLKPYIKNIIIEGHTDTDGNYMYNLKLSQKRAFSVLEYLYSQSEIDKKLLRKFVSANGRSYSDIITKNGKEDKDASRRIEVKFNISNKKAVQEIEDFLNGNY